MVLTRARKRQTANVNSTIYLLPTEVFAHILIRVVSDDAEHWTVRPLVHLLSTAGRFRDVAFNTPSMWPYLSSSTSLACQEAIVQHNSEGSLAIIMRMSDTLKNRIQLRFMVGRHSKRCTALWFEKTQSYGRGGEVMGLDDIWPLISPNASDLNIRDFTESRRGTVLDVGDGPPILSLSLLGVSFLWSNVQRFGSLISLSISADPTVMPRCADMCQILKEAAGLKWLSLSTLPGSDVVHGTQVYQAEVSEDFIDESIRLELVGLHLRCVEGALLKAIFRSIAVESLKYVEVVGISTGLELIFSTWATKYRNHLQDLRSPVLATLSAAWWFGSWDLVITIPSSPESLPPWNVGLDHIVAGIKILVHPLSAPADPLPGLKNFCSCIVQERGAILQVIEDTLGGVHPPYRFIELFPSLREIHCNEPFAVLPILKMLCPTDLPHGPAYPRLHTLTGFFGPRQHGQPSLDDILAIFASDRAAHMKSHGKPGNRPQWKIELVDSDGNSKITLSLDVEEP